MGSLAAVRSVFLCPGCAELALAVAQIPRFLPLIAADAPLDLPEYAAGYGRDRSAQRVDSGTGIEIEHVQKVLRLEVFLRPLHAPAEQRVGGAGGNGIPEETFDAAFIILAQPAAGKDVEQFILVLVPVFCGKVICGQFKLVLQKRHGGAEIEGFGQRSLQHGQMLRLYFPKVHRPGGAAGAGI